MSTNDISENKEVEGFRQTLAEVPKAEELFDDNFDTFISCAYDNDLLDKFPALGWLMGLAKGTQETYNEFIRYRFCKKAYKFLFFTKDIDRDKLNDFFREYSKASGEDGYELLLSVIDRVDNLVKVKYLANLLKAKLEGKISIDDYIRLNTALQLVPFIDLKTLPSYTESRKEGKDTYSLFASGLLVMSNIDPKGTNSYQLSENGLLLAKYGMEKDVSKYKKGNTSISGMVTYEKVDDLNESL